MIDRAVNIIRRHGYNITSEIESGINVLVKPVSLERCLMNILANAEKFSQKAIIKLYKKENYLIISLDDNGMGIEEKYRKDVFKPFFRIENSRNKNTGGVGLGLSIVADVIKSHGGDISISESSLGGLSISIKIPI